MSSRPGVAPPEDAFSKLRGQVLIAAVRRLEAAFQELRDGATEVHAVPGGTAFTREMEPSQGAHFFVQGGRRFRDEPGNVQRVIGRLASDIAGDYVGKIREVSAAFDAIGMPPLVQVLKECLARDVMET